MARALSALLLALALAAPLALGAKEFVVTLTASNFDEVVGKADFIVVEFYAPWCGHCKSLAPEYEKAAKALSEDNVPIVLAKMDADNSANKAVASKFDVKGFPTIKIFRKGDLANPQDYKGPREAAGIVSFLKKQAGPASQELKSTAEIQATLDADSVIVVGVFPETSGPAFETFMSVADAMRSDYTFRHTSDASLLPVELPKVEGAAVRVIKSFDEGYADITEFDEASLKAFVSSNALPILVEFSQDPKHRAFLSRAFESPSNKSLLFYAYNLTNAGEFREIYTKVAKTRPAGLTFLIGEDSQNEHALKYFGIEQKETPCIIIHDSASNGKYYRTGIEPQDVETFINDFLSGKEEKKLKSEPIPATNDEPVTVLVGKNFEELVLKSNKNVLLEFYAPWCGHCKKLDPIYKQVGAAFKDDSDVVIAKMDYTANDLPTDKFPVQGFPTLYFYTKAGEVVPYKGDRSKGDLIAFVKAQKEAAANASQAEPEEEELAAAAEEAATDSGASDGKDEL